MDVDLVTRLRRVLACTGWPDQARALVDTLVDETVMARGLVVTASAPGAPHHLAAHLDEVARARGDDRLAARPGGPAAVAAAGAGESVLVVATSPVGPALADALHAAHERGACLTSIDVGPDPVLDLVVGARLTVRRGGHPEHVDALPLDVAEHLVASLLLHRDDRPSLARRILETLGV